MNAYIARQHDRETIKLKNPQEKKHETEYIFYFTLVGKLVGFGFWGVCVFWTLGVLGRMGCLEVIHTCRFQTCLHGRA